MNDLRPCYKDVAEPAIAQWFVSRSQPAFRCRQVREWQYRFWATDFEEMTNLPKALRQALAESFRPFALACVRTQQAEDGTTKYLFQLGDGHTIETVLLRAPRLTTVCISTQVGCPVRCTFCASGRQGFARNLTAAEIVDQVVYACRELKARVDNVVVMGMGEPLLNLDSLLPALDTICSPDGLGFGARHITISTSGIVPGIRHLAALARQWNLALSLHATSDAARRRFIPDGHRYPLAEVLAACAEYHEKSSRMVTFEYTLMTGQNDGPQDAAEVARLARQLHAKVNVIPYNATGGTGEAPAEREVQRFVDLLAKHQIQATVRRERGAEIAAACGQLRRQHADSED